MQIKIGKVPGRTQVLELQEGATIAEAVRRANLDVTGHELRFNGVSTEDFNKEVTDGAIVLLTPRIKGNSDEIYFTVSFHNIEYVLDKNSTVEDLVEAAEWSEIIEEDETVAIYKEEKWVAVGEYDRIVPYGKYDVFCKSDVEYPVVVEEETHTCNCGGNCGRQINLNEINESAVKITVGGFEITVKKM